MKKPEFAILVFSSVVILRGRDKERDGWLRFITCIYTIYNKALEAIGWIIDGDPTGTWKTYFRRRRKA